ncbi:type II toxin-antitoxin system HicB family antitoxin [Laspinema olomoucense]|uniref:Type II toxin-antitoxin system HicB family antitoxin n=1 Tax=Laspinema olomoucense D3b TaxID=2953688 RepID=A0ABT2NF42_9CYAN|nr:MULTISPECIES: type II toxin-antitoxin system HicB family antitoxin [unclassified Laspinema]MCT7981328.1 type II toxin-antitoxin system HicB family antitoxin [Laspinema sp. D3b]MCT7990896.1 type II toxin-antitoxin system HicB family antitoxin [Laspinema sp. D3a]MCT7993173.1 type II toxin-antitoxin system HicB family antitoxin [Laspinema sp. D3c]
MKIKAIIHAAEEGGYWAEVPALPGCITEGDTWEEVTQNLQDAVAGWLSVANNSLKKTEPTDESRERFLENTHANFYQIPPFPGTRLHPCQWGVTLR